MPDSQPHHVVVLRCRVDTLSGPGNSATFQRLVRLRRQRRVRNAATLGLVVLGPVLALATYLVLGPLGEVTTSTGLRLLLLTDLVYVLALTAMVLIRVARMIAARRARSAGSRLHLRLTGVFALVALVPTVLVAVFATLTVNFGLEGWFSDRVQRVVGASMAAAEAYEQEHRSALEADARALARFLSEARRNLPFLPDGELRQLLVQAQGQIQRGIKEAYVLDGTGDIRARGDRSYLFDFERPSDDEMARARAGEVVIIEDWNNDEFRALVRLDSFVDRYLYITREVDGALLNLLDDTKETVAFYRRLEAERGRLLFEFGLLYIGFATLLIIASIWLGLWFAERIAQPVGRLASAAQRVGQGDLDVQVTDTGDTDEIGMLGRLFNQMTRQLKAQREAILESHRQSERRRRLFDSVLGSVTAGVIGLDAEGRIDFMNRSAMRLLGLEAKPEHGAELAKVAPEFMGLFRKLREGTGESAQEEVRVSRDGRVEHLLARLSVRRKANDILEGYVLAFDDVTDLVSAQRMAAWGDVARRIAHEIKNPLTPIQLSAERIKRKYRRQLPPEDAADLEQMTEVIVRQTNDLRRIVDEFSRFARMPEPDRAAHDVVALVRDAVTLQEAAMPGVRMSVTLPETPIRAEVDQTMLGQALTNLIKNAGEAIEARREKMGDEGWTPEIRVTVAGGDGQVRISIADNGIGLPPDRARLFEPYVTTREKGTGLGLPIVRKIVEEHGGQLELSDAEPFDDTDWRGAEARVTLPVLEAEDGARPTSEVA
ncbi:MAG: PAS domain-containing sensor histidine kinase [Alphaproteobacteria bacterium]|nr:MAG: PAS domain-containing sensor histidine kinase [Alphaproteobacteria bacterium]